MRIKTWIAVAFATAFIWACNQTSKPTKEVAENNTNSASCESDETIKDPNNTKPMALMMRQMAANADSIKSMIMRGEKPDSLRYPFIRFYLVEPTDPNVLQPQFFENARLFQNAYRDLMSAKADHKQYYNLMINACVKCHEQYCSGPLKRIRKLPINS
jgi:hypothetical protein